jgi:predicted GH43/DUF377 family glycosyl hydrolase
MKWKKQGLIYRPTGEMEWSQSHAQVPVADFLEAENRIRIYFSTRDAQGRSMPGVIEVDADEPSKILHIAKQPILGLGEIGTFDDCGVMPSWIVNHQGKKYLYYIGWNVRNTIAYHNSVGLAISKDGGKTFSRFSNGPLWDRNYREPHYSGTSCVLIENGIWRNYYLNCTEWRIIDGRSEPRYHLKYAESKDGIEWHRQGVVAIDYASDEEAGLVKASVIRDGEIYKMWFAHRNFSNYRSDKQNSYRIGYAESGDGIKWERRDERAGIDIGPEPWDDFMITYPHVIDVKGKRLMFYNGNGFGQSGFGYAVLEGQ